jgi:hypothetical protein
MSTRKKPPRHEVISVRLNEERLGLLERYRQALNRRLKREVSVAEAAFLMMEERAPEVDRDTLRDELLQAPTAALVRIRKRWASEHTWSHAEWDVVAEYVQVGAEEERQAPPILFPAVPSRESFLAALDAFEAVYLQRKARASRHVWAYFGNLGGHSTDIEFSDAEADADQRHQAVIQLVALRRAHLQASTDPWQYPGNVGRCFLLAVRDEDVPSAKLDQILAPYWPSLWGLAARGHWIRHDRQPVRAVSSEDDPRRRFETPAAETSGDVNVSFVPTGLDLLTQITLSARGAGLMLHRYPELVELRALLDAPDSQSRRGRNFEALVSREGTDRTRTLWLRHDAYVDLSPNEWAALRAVFDRAWASSDLQRWLHELRQEYGEHG